MGSKTTIPGPNSACQAIAAATTGLREAARCSRFQVRCRISLVESRKPQMACVPSMVSQNSMSAFS